MNSTHSRLHTVSPTEPESNHNTHPSYQDIDTSTFPALMTVREVATRLRVDDTTVRRWIKTGALVAVTLPHPGKRSAYRVRADTIARLLQGGGTNENS